MILYEVARPTGRIERWDGTLEDARRLASLFPGVFTPGCLEDGTLRLYCTAMFDGVPDGQQCGSAGCWVLHGPDATFITHQYPDRGLSVRCCAKLFEGGDWLRGLRGIYILEDGPTSRVMIYDKVPGYGSWIRVHLPHVLFLELTQPDWRPTGREMIWIP